MPPATRPIHRDLYLHSPHHTEGRVTNSEGACAVRGRALTVPAVGGPGLLQYSYLLTSPHPTTPHHTTLLTTHLTTHIHTPHITRVTPSMYSTTIMPPCYRPPATRPIHRDLYLHSPHHTEGRVTDSEGACAVRGPHGASRGWAGPPPVFISPHLTSHHPTPPHHTLITSPLACGGSGVWHDTADVVWCGE